MAARRPARIRLDQRTFDARPDTADFRDAMYQATLVEVPPRIEPKAFTRWRVPVRDQGREGACTGFGLATVADYLLRRRRVDPDSTPVSPRMLYEMAKRYDEWAGEQYEGSSARGAMKGWHKHGVASEELWPYRPRRSDLRLTSARAEDAATRPLGAYYRVNHKDLVALHAALAEVGILYATATVHEGWDEPDADGIVRVKGRTLGGHAFALVAYDARGFWIQNSWGPRWGKGGLALLTYDDWLAHATDVWAARLGVPVTLRSAAATAASRSAAAGQAESYAYRDVRPHIVSLGNDGRLRTEGTYGTSPADVAAIFTEAFPRITKQWPTKRLFLYAHGGLVDEGSAIQRVADYRTVLLDAHVYPLAFIWKSDYWTTLTNILQDVVRRRRPEGVWDTAKDFMLDRLDDALERLARTFTGKATWDEMKENALMATTDAQGGARIALKHLEALLKADPNIEIHVAAHSAGAVFCAPLIQRLAASGPIRTGPLRGGTGYGRRIASCALWAPACTTRLFRDAYLPAIQSREIERFALFTLTDEAEQDDHLANIYHKSLLYLVSNAFEDRPRVPWTQDGEPILGMEKFVKRDGRLRSLFRSPSSGPAAAEWILAPNAEPEGSPYGSGARQHGDFDDDAATLAATVARIAGRPPAPFTFNRSRLSLRAARRQLAGPRDPGSAR